MRFRELIVAACLASAASAGCSIDRGVWPDVPNLRPEEAVSLAQDLEGPPSHPVEDIESGRGRVAQYGRRLLMEIGVLDEGGEPSEVGAVTVLWPPVDRARLPGSYIPVNVNSGEVPEYFFTCIAGMREGGVRSVKLPAVRSAGDTTTRSFRDAETGAEIRIPSDRQVGVRVRMAKVTKPRIALLTTYSIPAMRNRRVVEF